MRAHLLQMDMSWENKPASHAHARTLLERADPSPGDMILLPEMFDTGFSLNVDRTNDDDGASAAFLRGLATETGCLVQGGVTIRGEAGAKALNRSLTYGPDGALLGAYDKIHPFTFGREGEKFTGGDRVRVFEYRGLQICPAICYDLRFPELFRAGLDAGGEVFTVIANWPEARAEHWRTLLIARAIENQAYVLGVNRTGSDPHLGYRGDSLIVSPQGEILKDAGVEAGVISAAIEPEAVKSWRERFPAWRDRRDWRGEAKQ